MNNGIHLGTTGLRKSDSNSNRRLVVSPPRLSELPLVGGEYQKVALHCILSLLHVCRPNWQNGERGAKRKTVGQTTFRVS